MNHLHAYWRMEYIEAPKREDGSGNPFPGLAEARDPAEALRLYRDDATFLLLNKFPYNAGHLLALPRRAVADLCDLSAPERTALMDCICLGKTILQKGLNPDGFNIGFNFGDAGGAGIPQHLHCHIVPRWSGDTNFMPVLGETRVLPASLEAMWNRLEPIARKLAGERSGSPAHA
ncbi:MAG: HIT family protein [Opitutales bacterium]